jgi:hypothetical protein
MFVSFGGFCLVPLNCTPSILTHLSIGDVTPLHALVFKKKKKKNKKKKKKIVRPNDGNFFYLVI